MATTDQARTAAEKARDWTAKRDALIVKLASEGMSYRQIGEVVGMSHGGIDRVLKRATTSG